jgi:hypothetical protein
MTMRRSPLATTPTLFVKVSVLSAAVLLRTPSRSTAEDLGFNFARGSPPESEKAQPSKKFSVTLKDKKAILSDAATGKELRTFSTPAMLYCFNLSADGELLVVGGRIKADEGDNWGYMCVWRTQSGSLVDELRASSAFNERFGGAVRKVEFDKPGKTVYYSGDKYALDGP